MLSVRSTIHNMCSDAGVEDVFVLANEPLPPLRKIPNSNPMGTVERGRPTSWNTVLLNQLSAFSTTIFGHNNFTSAVLKSKVGLHIHGTQNVISFHFASTPQADRNVLNLLSPLTVISVCQCDR